MAAVVVDAGAGGSAMGVGAGAAGAVPGAAGGGGSRSNISRRISSTSMNFSERTSAACCHGGVSGCMWYSDNPIKRISAPKVLGQTRTVTLGAERRIQPFGFS